MNTPVIHINPRLLPQTLCKPKNMHERRIVAAALTRIAVRRAMEKTAGQQKGTLSGLNRRIPLRDEQRSERRVLSDSDSLGCGPLMLCASGFALFVWASWDLAGLIEWLAFGH